MGRIGNIVNRKNKQDAKKAKIFTKYARLIAVAAKEGGADPEYNAALKNAIDKAKTLNMPNDNIDRAVKKGAGSGDSDNFETVIYEGYGPGGVAVIIETLTDNKNRTAGNIRYYLDKNGGNLGTSGCVSFMFDRKGQIIVNNEESNISEDDIMEVALEAGAEDIVNEEDCYVVYTATEEFSSVKSAIESKAYPIVEADIKLIPQTLASLDEEQTIKMEKMIDMIEDDDDVQNIYHNWDIED